VINDRNEINISGIETVFGNLLFFSRLLMIGLSEEYIEKAIKNIYKIAVNLYTNARKSNTATTQKTLLGVIII
jgi:hypothetical protein